jgi:hypothetical protein
MDSERVVRVGPGHLLLYGLPFLVFVAAFAISLYLAPR